MNLARHVLAAGLLLGGCGVVSQPPVAVTPPPEAAPVAATPAESSALPKMPTPAKAPAKAPPSAAKAAAAPPKQAATPREAVPAKPPALDLKSLEARLKESGAIGVLTKLSLKNQVDDLVARFRAFHEGQRPPTLAELRPSYELLLMKVLSLLQDKDTALASDIDASRDAIWAVLADRGKLAQYS
jgi:hypothetical protein